MGFDPGLVLTGYACAQGDARGDVAVLEAGVFRLGTGTSVAARLAELFRDATELLERVRPDTVAVEALFAHYAHPATAITMGHARGVILLAAQRAGARLVELRPNAVKKSLTGHGHAGKGQMQRAVQARFGLASLPEPPDVADAIAIAACALWRRDTPDAPKRTAGPRRGAGTLAAAAARPPVPEALARALRQRAEGAAPGATPPAGEPVTPRRARRPRTIRP